MQSLVPRSEKENQIFSDLPRRRRILVLGSTGSIGQAALDIIEQFPEHFELLGIVALGSDPQKFAAQVKRFSPKFASVINHKSCEVIEGIVGKKIQSGLDSVLELCSHSEVDLVLAAIVGAAGLAPVLAALNAGKIVALANKESLVVGGELVRSIREKWGPRILPVDSEHSGIFQCLLAGSDGEIDSLVLTASGGPFLKKSLKELEFVTPQEAINHPRWKMGPKISVDSATLMNKALEIIEAHYLYALPAQKLSAIIHPQSSVHAIVNLCDGSSLLQASVPDMKEPITFALNFPRPRLKHVIPKLDLALVGNLEFQELQADRFPAVSLARQCISAGSIACIVLNEANEFAVQKFLQQRLRFIDILPFIQEVLAEDFTLAINKLEDITLVQASILRHCDFVLSQFNVV